MAGLMNPNFRTVSAAGWGQIGLLALLVAVLVRPLGGYISCVYAGERTALWAGFEAGGGGNLPVGGR